MTLYKREDRVASRYCRSVAGCGRSGCVARRGGQRETRRDDPVEHVKVDRLDHEIVGTGEPRPERDLALGLATEEHEGNVTEGWRSRGQSIENIEARHRGHHQIRQHQVGRGFEDRRTAVRPAIGGAHLVAPVGQLLGDQVGDLAIILDDLNSLGVRHCCKPIRATPSLDKM
jgi:hypothetical protein